MELLSIIINDESSIADFLNVVVLDKWTDFGKPMFIFALEKIKFNPESQKWWTYLPIDIASNTLIGTCGFKGMPDSDRTIEIGYEIASSFRNQGYATEVAKALIKIAFEDKGINIVRAHTLSNENASTCVLNKCGFSFVKELDDEDDGLIWRWELHR